MAIDTQNKRVTTGGSSRGLSELAKSQQQTQVASAQGGSASSAGGTSISGRGNAPVVNIVDKTPELIRDSTEPSASF